jgi:phosphoribosylanthranilate isomerase
MPSGPGPIPEALIAEIAAAVPPPVATVLLTSRTDPADIVAQQRRCGVNTIQICDRLPQGAIAALRAALPGVRLIQVVHVVGESSVGEALALSREADALLLDTGDPSLPVRVLGGTGRRHDWALSARIVRSSPVPVFLAGGLTADNVGEAIRTMHPFGLDLCTGVRTDGHLDEDKLARFFAAVTAA